MSNQFEPRSEAWPRMVVSAPEMMTERDFFRLRQFFGRDAALFHFVKICRTNCSAASRFSGSTVASMPSKPGSPGV